MKIFKKTDFVIIIIVFLTIFIPLILKNETNKGIFVVKLNGQEILELNTPGDYEIKDEKGKLLMIAHFDGKNVWVTDSICPLKICEKTGKISEGGKIICVPNKIVIETRKPQELQTW
ncbi:NusG domain II-containing protein [Thermosipho atlanticus]|uniref:Uncharacterized protein n=1 Tax=Thermosipho atlanticus DSM 15807 TaxID=1123380 RepID=A0A1M5RWS4_9BACT|nr:NusG domain II-containing protein [Thermosipho atlanticus]SHH30807.1 hypothetical protein SAMN02745199_0671 [Thermosipho atlanticus DSM 15807]